MAKYAVVKLQGSQYKVSEGEEIKVSRLPQKEGETAELDGVLLTVEDGKVKVGKPVIKEAKVKMKVLKHFSGEKLDIFKFKAKTGYRRKMGFRPELTLVRIEEIAS